MLLAGATGIMGGALIPRLLERGHEVVGTTRVPGSLDGTGADEVVANVLEREKFIAAASVTGCEAVINQMGCVRNSTATYRGMRGTNRLRAEGTNTLIATAHALGATKYVGSSIAYGYGFGDHGDTVLDEKAPLDESGDGHLAAVQSALVSLEQQVHAFGGVSLRYGVIYTREGPIPPVASDWDGVLPFVHLDDAVDATVLALEAARHRVVYNIADDTPASWRAVHEARAAWQGTHRPLHLPTWAFTATAPFAAHLVTRTQLRVSNAFARRSLRWKPKYPSYLDALGVRGDA